jgi:hypothetical protein
VTALRSSARVAVELAIALAALCALLAVYFLWMLLPLAGILAYVIAQYAFVRRRRRNPVRHARLVHEAEARAAEIRRHGHE